jgi:hypothetical protein
VQDNRDCNFFHWVTRNVEIWIKGNELAEGKIRGKEGQSCES